MNVGSVDVGAASTPLPVSITNTGGVAAPLTVTAAPAGLIAATGCTGSLLPSQSCVLQVTATPTAVGAFQGSVTVAATGGNTVVIVVQGNGTPPGNFAVAPTAIDLGSLAVGEIVQTAVTVTANANLTGLSTTVRGTDVRIEPTSTCGATLSANQSCTVAVRFTAGAAGASTGNAVVVSQGGVTKTVPITATVLAGAKLAATPPAASLTARAGETSPPQTINIGNIGGMATGQLAVAIAPASFKVVSETCSIVTLAAGATCSVVIAYAPAATATANETGTLTVTDRGVGASTATVQLNGVLQTSTTLTLAGGPALGNVAPGAIGAEVVFTVTNTSATPSGALTAAVIPPTSITISSNTCATKTTLLQAETCTIGLRLTPAAGAAPAAIAAVLTVTAANGSVSASVTGNVVIGGLPVATPTSVNFGSVFVNQLSAIKTVTITNGGGAATGVLSVNLTGQGAAQVALAGNTCTAALAPAQSCTLSVQYGPTDTTGVNGIIAVTDGIASVSIPMVGTGLASTNFLACKQTSGDVPASACETYGEVVASDLDMGAQTVGYKKADANGLYTVRVVVTTGATSDSGVITAALSGTNAADFAIANNKCTTALNPGGNCTMDLTFTPAAAGSRTAVLTITGAKGGVWNVNLKGLGMALVEITGLGCTNELLVTVPDQDPNSPSYSLEFGQQPNNTAGNVCKYRVAVRGATSPAATTTTTDLALATSTPPDFRNVTVSDGVQPAAANPCDNAVLTLAANTGLPPAGGSVGPWAAGDGNANDTVTESVWVCDFHIQFYPQTGKSTAPGDKTATVTATASAGGSDSVALKGTSTGPLTIETSPADFGDVNFGAASATNTTLTVATTLTTGTPTGIVKTLTVKNEGIVNQGILGVVLGGTNAGDFGITNDGCTGETLAPAATCPVSVIFVPTSAGAKTATITVTAATGGESTTGELKGNATNPYAIAVTPAAGDFTPAGTAPTPQGKGSAWLTFTVAQPATAPRSGKLSYGIGDCTTPYDGNFEIFTATSGQYPAGSCGDSNTAQLDSTTPSCTVQVRFRPSPEAALDGQPLTSTLNVCVADAAGSNPAALPEVKLSGIPSPELTVAGTAISVVDNEQTLDFGNVAVAVLTSTTITVTNNSLANAALTSTLPGGISITGGTCPASGGTLAASASCTIILSVTIPADAPAIDDTITLVDGALANTAVSLRVLAKPVTNARLELFGMDPLLVGTEAAPIEFGEVAILSSAANGSGVVTLWFINSGGLPAKSITNTIANGDTTDTNAFSLVAESKGTCFSLTNNQLDPGKTCSARLQFKPTNTTGGSPAGRKTAAFTLTGETVTSNAVHLAGNAVGNPPAVAWVNVVGSTNSVYTFPSTAIGSTTGSTVYFEVHNPTASPAAVAQPANTDFVADGAATAGGTPCPADLVVPAATTCQIRVTFKPAAPWDMKTKFRVGSLVVAGKAAGGLIGQAQQPAKLRLTATGSTAVKVETGVTGDGAVDFGQIIEGVTPLPSVTFTVTNIGEGTTVGLPALDLGGGASYLDQGDCGTVRLAGTGGGACAAGAVCSCTATVTVLGSLSRGAYTGALVTAVDQTATPGEISDEEFAVGVRVVSPALVKLTPATADFSLLPAANSGTYVGETGAVATFTVSNGAAGDTSSNRQDAKGVKVQLSDSVNFKLAYGTCAPGGDGTFVLNSDKGESCTVTVTFKPGKVGALTATLSVTNTTVAGTATASLKGKGLGSLTIAPVSTSEAAERTPVTSGGTTLVITNNGGDKTNLLRTTLSSTAKFAVVEDSCFGQMLYGGQSCTVTVVFTGTAAEAATPVNAELTVSDGSTTSTNNTVTGYLKSAVPPA